MSSPNTSDNNSTQHNDPSSSNNSDSTSCHTHAVKQMVEASYIPNMPEYLRTDEGSRPVVNCSICGSKVLIPGLPGHSKDPSNDEEYEDLCILPCGHVFGTDCFFKSALGILQTMVDGPGPLCPVCQEPAFPDLMGQDDIIQRLEDEYDAEMGESESMNPEGNGEVSEAGDDEEGPVSRATQWPALSLGTILASGAPSVPLLDDEEEF
jgi:hypothetical protein